MHVLDTSAIIEVMHSTRRGRKIMDKFGDETVTTTSVVAHELLKGDPRLAPLLKTFTILDYDFASAQVSGPLYKEGKEKGKIPPFADLLIASTCIARKAVLVTTDSDFFNFEGLNIEHIS